MIANIVCQQGEGSLDLNSYERIYHSNNRAFEDTTGWRWTNNGTHSITRNTDIVTGSNLIPDSASTFATSGVGWYGKTGCTFEWVSGDSTALFIGTGTNNFIIKTFSNMTAGDVYKFTMKLRSPNVTTIPYLYSNTTVS